MLKVSGVRVEIVPHGEQETGEGRRKARRDMNGKTKDAKVRVRRPVWKGVLIPA